MLSIFSYRRLYVFTELTWWKRITAHIHDYLLFRDVVGWYQEREKSDELQKRIIASVYPQAYIVLTNKYSVSKIYLPLRSNITSIRLLVMGYRYTESLNDGKLSAPDLPNHSAKTQQPAIGHESDICISESQPLHRGKNTQKSIMVYNAVPI